MDSVVFHIISRDSWEAALDQDIYEPEGYGVEGFIHLSTRGQILRPANLLYRGRNDLLLLEISSPALKADLRYEPGSHGEDELFPHLYGALNVDAVRKVHDFPCGVDGTFRLPDSLIDANERR